jgi:hypothetical protein
MRKDKKNISCTSAFSKLGCLVAQVVNRTVRLLAFIINYYSVSIWFIFKWCKRALSSVVPQDICQTKRKRQYLGLPRMTQIWSYGKNPSQGWTESFPERTLFVPNISKSNK